jgi:diguanylate cyclase
MAINKILDGGEPHDDPIEAAKRKVYLVATPIGILSMLVVWAFGIGQKDLGVSRIFILPLLAILFLALCILLLSNTIPLRTFELSIYTLVLALGLYNFVSITLTITLMQVSFSPELTLWLPFIYLLSFLVLSTNLALLFSAFFFMVMLSLGLASYLHFLQAGLAYPNISILVQLYFASAFYIAVLYLIALIKERYILEHAVAADMAKLAMTDSLTQVDNRRLLTQLLREEVNRAERHNLPLSVLLFDLDRFKKMNDSFGHNTGDGILKEAAQVLRQSIRASDPFGRWGGDEFLCLATNSGKEQAVELAERLRFILQNHHFKAVDKITASFGVTTYQKGDSPETLIRRADLGLYKAKAGGRNRVEVVIAGITLPLFEGEKPYPVSDENAEYD